MKEKCKVGMTIYGGGITILRFLDDVAFEVGARKVSIIVSETSRISGKAQFGHANLLDKFRQFKRGPVFLLSVT